MSARGKSGARGIRVADQLQRELAEQIQREVKDPRVGLVTLTGVDLTPDYAVATVWYTVLPSDAESLARTEAGLQQAAKFLRGRVGRSLGIHTAPELRFVLDRSVERGVAMSRLIDEANRPS
jgi:ribosome-binding factor A